MKNLNSKETDIQNINDKTYNLLPLNTSKKEKFKEIIIKFKLK
jgi:hypothetical protein